MPLVVVVTSAGILSLGLAALASWALLAMLLLRIEAGAEADRFQRRATLTDRSLPASCPRHAQEQTTPPAVEPGQALPGDLPVSGSKRLASC